MTFSSIALLTLEEEKIKLEIFQLISWPCSLIKDGIKRHIKKSQYKKLEKIGITEQGHDTKQLFQRARLVVK